MIAAARVLRNVTGTYSPTLDRKKAIALVEEQVFG